MEKLNQQLIYEQALKIVVKKIFSYSIAPFQKLLKNNKITKAVYNQKVKEITNRLMVKYGADAIKALGDPTNASLLRFVS